jgi:hypothetical protein
MTILRASLSRAILGLCPAVFLLLAMPAEGQAAEKYTFTGIAQSPDGFGGISMNAAGTVAFQTTGGIFKGSGGALTTIHSSGSVRGFPAINPNGTVVFLLDGGVGIGAGNGGPITIVASNNGQGEAHFDGVEAPSINNAAMLSFIVQAGGNLQIVRGSDASGFTVVDNVPGKWASPRKRGSMLAGS